MNFHPLSVIPCNTYASFLVDGKLHAIDCYKCNASNYKLHERSPTISRRPECDCRRRRRLPSLARMFAVDVISQNGLRSEERKREGDHQRNEDDDMKDPMTLWETHTFFFHTVENACSMQILCDIATAVTLFAKTLL